MGAFYNGFVFTLVAILIFILFMLFYYFDKLEKQNQLLVDLSKAKVESTTWINTLLSRILTHFRTDLAVKYINEEVSKSLGPDFNFSLRTIGEDVKISPVSTLEEEGKPPILFITVSWEDGVSFDIEKLSNLQGKPIDKPEERIKVEIDVRKVEVTTKLHWRDENTILLNFFYPSKTDFDVTVNLFVLTFRPSTKEFRKKKKSKLINQSKSFMNFLFIIFKLCFY
ncbi:uncharacterized protein GO595_011057 [Histomonas meleagridis]|uniref:uncharacterized protein n=1 Tax=Histomonas meleagridis TaxID=135588 RepID=UPI003559D6B0|nr:hypothetical protein GO595_011057 [Histomonas meleagridis]